FLLLSYLLPRLNLLGLRPDISFDGLIYAGEAVHARISVLNEKRRIPAYSVHVISAILPEPVTIKHLAGKGLVVKQAMAVFDRRGLYPTVSLTMESSFPFILFYAKRRVDIVKDVVVYPAYYDIDLKGDTPLAAEGSGRIQPARTGDDMVHIRHFRDGDDPRQISWKATAKRSGLMVRESALQESTRTTVVLVNGNPEAAGDFEKVVSIAAALARDFIGRGDSVRIVSGNSVVPFGSGYEHLLYILDTLALVREDGPGEGRNQGVVLPDEEGEVIVVLKSGEVREQMVLPEGARIIYADTV
ncbi:MAG: DUF58 domain-containing protein, partial [Thermodesulfovibrionales bacterium]